MAVISEEDRQAKMRFITAFFDDFLEKARFLDDLYESDRRDEARILCSCYIDGLASALYWPDERSNFNYVRSLKEYGGQDVFSYTHPKMLDDAIHELSKRGEKWRTIHARVSNKLREIERRLYDEEEIVDLLAPLLTASQMNVIKRKLWRGTFAAIVYNRFRLPSVHGFGPPDGITFDGTTFRGEPVPAIDFPMVNDCLKRILFVAKDLSESTGRWFGHDYK